MNKLKLIVISALLALTACSSAVSPSSVPVGESPAKSAENGNPLISNVFCADPTAVEYNGRLYVYGTNDHQQYEKLGAEGENTYQYIKSLVMLSTDDMANWTYHGIIDTESISPWVVASWAPSVVSREESDGQTHFYLYYSNSGCGVGVLTATSPTGPWSDPLGKGLIDSNTKGLDGCKIPFDPGVVIDDNGDCYLSFGGEENGARIVKLGQDMISFDSEIAKIPTEYHFEASELNFINGTYVYTYNNDWETRIEWNSEGVSRPPKCSMAYLKTKTPLDPDSWEYMDYYFKNPGEQGLEYGNNHTHLHKYNGKYYLFYHALFPQKALGIDSGYRSICVNEAMVDEENVTISKVLATKGGVNQIKSLDPFIPNEAETMATSSGIKYNLTEEAGNTTVSVTESGGFTYVKNADFRDGAKKIKLSAKGEGAVDVYIDSLTGTPLASVKIGSADMSDFSAKLSEKISGEHDIYFVLTDNIEFDGWIFE